MWWFLVITLGSSIVPAYVAPQGPFANQEQCQRVQREAKKYLEDVGRAHHFTDCYEVKK